MPESILTILFLSLPAFLANMLPVIAQKNKWLPKLKKPVDGGLKFRGKELLGTHKTRRGLVVGTTGAMILSASLVLVNQFFDLELCVFSSFGIAIIYGFLAGSGALIGDAFESLLKRQIGIKSGRPFIPFDQIDYIIGFLIFTSLVYPWQTRDWIFLILFALLANLITNYVGYKLKIKSTYW